MNNMHNSIFDKFYKESYAKALSFAKRLSKNSDQAEDITQEAFLRAYQAFDRCDRTQSPDNWLKCIIKNVFLDGKRRESRRIRTTPGTNFRDEDLLGQVPDQTTSIESILTRPYIDEELVKVVSNLDPAVQSLLTLAYDEELALADIGRILGVGSAAARSRLHRIRVQIKKAVVIQRVQVA